MARVEMITMLRSYLDRTWWMRLIILFIIVMVKNFALPIYLGGGAPT
jgi:hypothetical protein